MDVEELEISGEVFDSVASEYTSDAVSQLVPVDPQLIAAVTEGDPDPKFATFVIESGWSKSKRYWGADLFQNVAEQINGSEEAIVGYMGHIKPEDDPFTFPEIQLHWLGARATKVGDKAKLAVKAYVLPNTKGRDYLKRGLVKTVSWRGKVAQIPYEKGVRVAQFAIESIDLSRPRAAGMSAKLVGALTSEMETEGSTDVKPEEIAALQEHELRAHNPALAQAIADSATKPLSDQVVEMTTTVDTLKPQADLIPEIKKLFGMSEDADVLEVLGQTASQLKAAGKTARDAILDAVLSKRFKDENTLKFVRRIIAAEMSDKDLELSGDEDKDEKMVGEMVDEIVNKDDDLKSIVSEMEDTPAAPPITSENRGKSRELKPGLTTSNIRVRSAR
jgi:hypothetical protein